jgi:cytochrome c oxidase subunit III
MAEAQIIRPHDLAEQFDDLEQQRHASTVGMWIFIVTEVMLFGGLFLGYTSQRWLQHDAFVEGSHHMDLIIGAVNTAVLIVSSLMMALAVQRAQRGERTGATTRTGSSPVGSGGTRARIRAACRSSCSCTSR